MRKLEKARELVTSLGCRLYLLKKHGFRKLKGANCSSPHIYINKKMGVVVKRPYLSWLDAPIPKKACPTIIIKTDEAKWGNLSMVFIQPIVDVSAASKWKAFSTLCKEGIEDVGEDQRESNCGMYRGKAVVFDW